MSSKEVKYWESNRKMAQVIAYNIHMQGNENGKEVGENALGDTLNREIGKPPKNETYTEEDVERFCILAKSRGGLLQGTAGVYFFVHHAFQEFLAARYLRQVKGTGADGISQCISIISTHLTEAWWREVILLLAGYWARNKTEEIDARKLIRELADAGKGKSPEERFSAVELAGTAALEWPACPDRLRSDLADDIACLYTDVESCKVATPDVRVRAGRVLSQLGDPRKGVGLDASGYPDIDWVNIPAGEFIYSEGKSKRTIPLPAYKISRYPITYRQFKAFTDDEENGYSNPRWWEGLDVDEEHRSSPREQWLKYDNHPREWVSWYEAMAFSNWLTNVLHKEITLPTEQ